MAKRSFQLRPEQIKELTLGYASCRDGPTRTRYQATRLYGTGYPLQEVMNITGCSRPALMEWCRKYLAGGIAALQDQRRGGNRARLSREQIEQLKVRLQRYTPADLFGGDAVTGSKQFWTVPDLRQAIQHWYGVCYQSPSSYLRYFALCGFSYQRPAKAYRSRREAQVAEFEAQLEKN